MEKGNNFMHIQVYLILLKNYHFWFFSKFIENTQFEKNSKKFTHSKFYAANK